MRVVGDSSAVRYWILVGGGEVAEGGGRGVRSGRRGGGGDAENYGALDLVTSFL